MIRTLVQEWYSPFLHKYIPSAPSQTNMLEFAMCGELKDLERATGRQRTAKELRQLNKAWFEITPKAFLSKSEEGYFLERIRPEICSR